jgi:PAS domain S-box-containing protein
MFERISLSAPDPLLLVDNEGAIRDANDAAAREFQYSRTVLRDLRLADLGDARVDGRFTARYRRADGTHFACEVNAGRVSAQGDVLCILRKLEPRTADDLYAQCFRRGPVAVSIVNMSDNKFVDINDAFLTSTGLAREQVIGKTFIELGIKLTMDAARAVIDRFIETFPERREDTYSVSLVEVMGMAAVDLGARELLPALRALLDTMLLNYSPKQRKAEMASAVEVLGRLAKVKGANATSAATSFKAVRGVALVEQAIVQAKADGTTANPLSAKALAKLTMPNGSPIPASLATWLAFDGS